MTGVCAALQLFMRRKGKTTEKKSTVFIGHSAIEYAVTTKMQEGGESKSNNGTLRRDEEKESDERR